MYFMQASVAFLYIYKKEDDDAAAATPQTFPLSSYTHFLLTDIPTCQNILPKEDSVSSEHFQK